jgi:hypothetical protein
VIYDLVCAGADISKRDNKGMSAIDLALELEHKECFNILNKAKCIKVNIKQDKVASHRDNSKSIIKKIGGTVYNTFKLIVKNKVKSTAENSLAYVQYSEGLNDSNIESIVIKTDETKELKISNTKLTEHNTNLSRLYNYNKPILTTNNIYSMKKEDFVDNQYLMEDCNNKKHNKNNEDDITFDVTLNEDSSIQLKDKLNGHLKLEML